MLLTPSSMTYSWFHVWVDQVLWLSLTSCDPYLFFTGVVTFLFLVFDTIWGSPCPSSMAFLSTLSITHCLNLCPFPPLSSFLPLLGSNYPSHGHCIYVLPFSFSFHLFQSLLHLVFPYLPRSHSLLCWPWVSFPFLYLPSWLFFNALLYPFNWILCFSGLSPMLLSFWPSFSELLNLEKVLYSEQCEVL